MYSSTVSLTSALDRGRWSTPRPGRFTPGKENLNPFTGDWAGHVWNGAEYLAPTGIRSPARPGLSESLHPLRDHEYLEFYSSKYLHSSALNSSKKQIYIYTTSLLSVGFLSKFSD